MSTFMIEPGARLADRYRLDEPISETGGATFWKATDETLARLVAIWTFAEGFAHTSDVVRAARATSRVADSRLTQVFDADDTASTPYVVEEWVIGQSLCDLLTQGPLDPERAAGLIAEAAETLATANETGLFHQHLSPTKLIWSVGGAVKVTGIGVDAALRGTVSENPAVTDARGLGSLMYAALTAHWPEITDQEHPRPEKYGLPCAPLVSGVPCPPNQLRSGVPDRLNELVYRSALQDQGRSAPLSTPREIADALSDIPRLVPLPVPPTSSPVPPPAASPSASRSSAAAAPPPPTAPPHPSPQSGGGKNIPSSRTLSRVLIGGLASLVFLAVVAGAWTLGSNLGDSNESTPQANKEQSGADNDKGDKDEKLPIIKPKSATGFDPKSDDGDEHDDDAKNAIDGDSSTQWKTEGYNSAKFGGLKSGVGLLIKLNEPAEVHKAKLALGKSGTADAEILVGDQPDMGSLHKAGKVSGAKGTEDVKLSDPAKGTYVCVWFTQLPQAGKYRGAINEVELRGKT